jgi:hypothetical protein
MADQVTPVDGRRGGETTDVSEALKDNPEQFPGPCSIERLNRWPGIGDYKRETARVVKYQDRSCRIAESRPLIRPWIVRALFHLGLKDQFAAAVECDVDGAALATDIFATTHPSAARPQPYRRALC